MPDKIVNHFVLADGSTAKYDAGGLLNLDETVSLAGYAPDAKAVGDRLTTVESFAVKTFEAVKVSDISGTTFIQGAYGAEAIASGQIIFATNVSTYNSVVLFVEEETKVYVDATYLSAVGYASICVGENASEIQEHDGGMEFIQCEIGSVARYRKSDNNMPTAENPLTVPAGGVLVFSETATANNWTYHLNLTYILASSLKLADEQVEQVLGSITSEKKPKIKYVNGAGEDHSTERVEIYLPTVVGYIKYNFVHSINASRNADVWRIANAYAVDDSLVQRFNLTTSGEWEVALHLNNRTDFSGGDAHGDEVYNAVAFFVDGVLVDIGDLTQITECEKIVVVETSNLYDPNDGTTLIAEHGSSHIFDADGLTIEQSIKWKIAEELTSCYMAMFPVAQSVTNKIYTDSNYTTINLPQRVSDSECEKAVLYSQSAGFNSEFSIEKFPDLNSKFFLCVDNGTTQYNKCYFAVTGENSGKFSTIGELWKSKAIYKLTVAI